MGSVTAINNMLHTAVSEGEGKKRCLPQNADEIIWVKDTSIETYQRALHHQMLRGALGDHIVHCSHPLWVLKSHLGVSQIGQRAFHP